MPKTSFMVIHRVARVVQFELFIFLTVRVVVRVGVAVGGPEPGAMPGSGSVCGMFFRVCSDTGHL